MRTAPRLRLAALLLALICTFPSPVRSQRAPEWRLGTGYLISRPRDVHHWGLNLRREQPLNRFLVYRGIASADIWGLEFLDPLLLTAGADIGVRAHLAPLTALIAVGPTLGYFISKRHLNSNCQATPCTTYQTGYEPGPLLAATASAALGLQVSSELKLFYEARAYVPSGIGRSGFAGDPHAAFVEIAFGVTLLR